MIKLIIQRMLYQRNSITQDLVDCDLLKLEDQQFCCQSNDIVVVHLKKIKKEEAAPIIDLIKSKTVDHIIVIYDDKCTPNSKKDFNALGLDKIEYFHSQKVLNFKKREKQILGYEILSEEEKNVLLESYKSTQLPQMCFNVDLVALYYNAPLGTIFRFYQTYGFTEKKIKYRVVSNMD